MDNLQFKNSITPQNMKEWTGKHTIITDGLIIINPAGYIEYTYIPTNDDAKMITSSYRVVIEYGNGITLFDGNVTCLFDVEIMNDVSDGNVDDEVTYETMTTPVNPYDDLVNFDIMYPTDGGIADYFKLRFRNLSNETVEIKSINMYPSYTVDKETFNTIEKSIPSIIHIKNDDNLLVIGERVIINKKLGLYDKSSLSLHLFINGYLSEDDLCILRFFIDSTELEYSPIKVDLTKGNVILSLPLNITNITSGAAEFKVTMQLSNSYFNIEKNKLQCTIEGKNIIQNISGSGSPYINVVDRVEFNLVELNQQFTIKDSEFKYTTHKVQTDTKVERMITENISLNQNIIITDDVVIKLERG